MGKKLVKYAVVDAFTGSPFRGNPAAVCFLEDERDDRWLQAVAAEFNLSETCYLTRISDSESNSATNPRFRLRWFTPVAEVDLCGHATLAAAHFLFTFGLVDANAIEFLTLSGVLTAKRVPDAEESTPLGLESGEAQDGFTFELDFPVVPVTEFDSVHVPSVSEALSGTSVVDIKKTTAGDLFVVLPSGKDVADLQPRFDEIENVLDRQYLLRGLLPLDLDLTFIVVTLLQNGGSRRILLLVVPTVLSSLLVQKAGKM